MKFVYTAKKDKNIPNPQPIIPTNKASVVVKLYLYPV